MRRRFLRRKTLAPGLYHQMQMDLVDLSSLRTKNKGFKYLLTAIDIFSRKAFAIPLKTKRGSEIVEALQEIFASYPYPKLIQFDQGGEFWNKEVAAYLKKHHIKPFFTSSDTKCALVERWNRTLKNKMFRYFTANNTLVYIPVLNALVQSYNNKIHSTIGVAPNKVSKTNERKIWEHQYKKYLQKYGTKTFKYDIGDIVRISKLSRVFRKGYLPTFQEEYFKIHDRLATYPPVYKLIDLNGEVLKGTFYEKELQKILSDKKSFKVLKTRKRKNKKEHLIHFIGDPPNLDKWVLTKDLPKR